MFLCHVQIKELNCLCSKDVVATSKSCIDSETINNDSITTANKQHIHNKLQDTVTDQSKARGRNGKQAGSLTNVVEEEKSNAAKIDEKSKDDETINA